MAWAFGLGLERIAMVLFQVPDIRLFWSQDARFLEQFSDGTVSQFKPFSKYPSSSKDVSFWLGEREVHENDVYDIVREVAGGVVEEVKEVSVSLVWGATSHRSTGRQIHTSKDGKVE